MTHPPDHSQPPVKAHWTSTYLPDEGATADLGAKLAAGIGSGMRIYLRGDLGSGKNHSDSWLVARLGVKDTVKSPSYALVELYVVSRLNLYHFDFYRFLDAREFEDAGWPTTSTAQESAWWNGRRGPVMHFLDRTSTLL